MQPGLSTRIVLLGERLIAALSAVTLHGTGMLIAVAADAAVAPARPVATAAAVATPAAPQRTARLARTAGAEPAPRPTLLERVHVICTSPLSHWCMELCPKCISHEIDSALRRAFIQRALRLGKL
jgi:hypothetical protein